MLSLSPRNLTLRRRQQNRFYRKRRATLGTSSNREKNSQLDRRSIDPPIDDKPSEYPEHQGTSSETMKNCFEADESVVYFRLQTDTLRLER